MLAFVEFWEEHSLDDGHETSVCVCVCVCVPGTHNLHSVHLHRAGIHIYPIAQRFSVR